MRKSILLTLALIVSLPINANDIVTSLNKDIKTAQQQLNSTQERLAKENKFLSDALAKTESKVVELRRQAEGLIRAQDEAALSIEQVETRLNEWQQQSQYQAHLLTRYLSANSASSDTKAMAELLTETTKQINKMDSNNGLFYSSDVVLPTGESINAQVINIGPFRYFVSENSAGLVDTSSKHHEVAITFSDSQHNALKQLMNTGEASILVDPSNGRALSRQQQQETILSHVAKGGVWVAPILLFAVFAIVIAIYKFVQLTRLPQLVPGLSERLTHLNNDLSSLKLGEWQTELVKICQVAQIGQQRDDKLFNALNDQKKQLDNLLGAIAITAAVAPLLGLLGTVSGMIETFKLMTLFGAGDPAAVFGWYFRSTGNHRTWFSRGNPCTTLPRIFNA